MPSGTNATNRTLSLAGVGGCGGELAGGGVHRYALTAGGRGDTTCSTSLVMPPLSGLASGDDGFVAVEVAPEPSQELLVAAVLVRHMPEEFVARQ